MEQIISKEELNELKKIEGKARGVSIKDYGDYLLLKKGAEGLKALEEATIKLGYPIDYRKLKRMDYYPLWFEGLTLLLIKRLFDFNDEEIQKMGRSQAKVSILIRIYMKYFSSLRKTAAMVPKIWRSFYEVGEIKIIDLDEEKKSVIIRIENFKLIPLFCIYISGYFSEILQLIVGVKTTCEETRCVHRGDPCHEFLLKW